MPYLHAIAAYTKQNEASERNMLAATNTVAATT